MHIEELFYFHLSLRGCIVLESWGWKVGRKYGIIYGNVWNRIRICESVVTSIGVATWICCVAAFEKGASRGDTFFCVGADTGEVCWVASEGGGDDALYDACGAGAVGDCGGAAEDAVGERVAVCGCDSDCDDGGYIGVDGGLGFDAGGSDVFEGDDAA